MSAPFVIAVACNVILFGLYLAIYIERRKARKINAEIAALQAAERGQLARTVPCNCAPCRATAKRYGRL